MAEKEAAPSVKVYNPTGISTARDRGTHGSTRVLVAAMFRHTHAPAPVNNPDIKVVFAKEGRLLGWMDNDSGFATSAKGPANDKLCVSNPAEARNTAIPRASRITTEHHRRRRVFRILPCRDAPGTDGAGHLKIALTPACGRSDKIDGLGWTKLKNKPAAAAAVGAGAFLSART